MIANEISIEAGGLTTTHREAFIRLQGLLEELDYVIGVFRGGINPSAYTEVGYATFWIVDPESRGGLVDITSEIAVVLGRIPGPITCTGFTRFGLVQHVCRELFDNTRYIDVRWI